jgi:hypothetical protein
MVIDWGIDGFHANRNRALPCGKSGAANACDISAVGDAVGWDHPTGRGLGKNLEVVLRALHDRGLPPLTKILVKRGERHPRPDAMGELR